MKIKSKKKVQFKFSYFTFFLKIYFFVSVILATLLIYIFFNTGYWKNYKNQFLTRLYTSSMVNYLYIPEITVKKFRAKFYKLPKININISFENQITLENQRKRRLETFGFSEQGSAFRKVNATVDFEEKKFRTDIRLKGDRKSHWFEKDRASYKLDLKNDKKIMGMEKFSLQKPRTKNYIHEWIFFELLGELSLIKLNYIFVDLSINGEDTQLYALEESFDKVLIERNLKRNGPIFSLHEEFSIEHDDLKFEVYNKKYWLSEENSIITKLAKKKLRLFFKNKQQNVFNKDKWARFFAITDLNYYPHARAVKSVKFFYNPLSANFEPIGYDAHRAVPNYSKHIESWYNLTIQNSFQDALNCKKNLDLCIKSASRLNGNYLVYRFFFDEKGKLNEDFFKTYKKYVYKITSDKFLKDFFSKRNSEIEKINSLIYDDYFYVDHNYFYGPGIYFFSKKDIFKRAKELRKFFNINIEKIFVEQENDKIIVSNKIPNNLDLKVNLIECIDNRTKKNYIFSYNRNLKNYKTIIKNSVISDILSLKCYKLILSDEYNNLFEKNIVQKLDDDINEYPKLNSELFKIFFDIKDDKLYLKEKTTIIKNSFIIPDNYKVIVSPGEKILLKDDAFIFSKSPWLAIGENNNKILITGEPNNYGGGIYISNTNFSSYFKNVDFQFLSGPQNYEKMRGNKSVNKNLKYNFNYILYGALNFYNTNVKLDKVSFKNICAEDVLNIISSSFNLKDLNFEENCSDGIDVDFGNGTIRDSIFKNIGNDAIDFSGSKVELKNIKLENIGDKLISIGENSNVKINNLKGNNSYIGIASKDGSLSILENIDINNATIGLAAYTKKNEYKPGKIIGNFVTIKNSKHDWLTDKDSLIILDDIKLNSSTKSLVKLIYGNEN